MKATSIKLAISVLLLGLLSVAAHAGSASSVSSAADQAARQMAEVFKPLWGTVISVLPNGRFVLDVTADTGGYVGMEMEVFREGEPFKHPVTGQVLGRMDRHVGIVRVIEVQEKFSLAEGIFLEKGKEIKQGDGVRVTAARMLVGLVNVSSSVLSEGQARALTREIEAALLKTGRFEVLGERMMRTTLAKDKEKVADATTLADPHTLQILRTELRLHAVIFPVVRAAEEGFVVDLKTVSTFSGRPLYLASAEVRTADSAPTKAPGRQHAEAQVPRAAPPSAAPAAPPDRPVPAWLGPPGQRSSDQFLAVPYMGIPSARLVLGPEFDAALQGIAVADLDGDGRKEVAVADKDRISIYAVQGRAFRRLWSSEGQSWERYNNILALDAADINGNGVAELFVTSFFGNEANSYLLEFQKGEWVRTWQEGGLFFRVMPNSRGEPVLYAQRGGADEPFSGRVNTYAARNGHYEPQSELKLPRGTYIYNFAVGDVRNDGSKQVLQISDEHRLRLFSAGKLRSEPSDRFGGTGVTFDFRPAIFANSLASQSESEFDRLYVHPRLWITDVDGDGTQELVAVRNMATTGRVLKHVVLYDKSKIVALRWGPLGFQILWETPDLEGYISDLFLGDLGDGGEPVLMFALVRPQRLGLVGAHSGLFLYRLARTAGEPQAGRSPEEERVLK